MYPSAYIALAQFAILAAGQFGPTCNAYNLGGRVWEDSNRNGIQDPDEPPLVGHAVYLSTHLDLDPFFSAASVTNFTDADGRYEFTGIPNGVRFVYITPDMKYRATQREAGDQPSLNSDFFQAFTFCGVPYMAYPLFTNTQDNTNIDAGLIPLVPELSISVTVNGHCGDTPYYITNGASVRIIYSFTNSGETALSYLTMVDGFHPDAVFLADCPDKLQLDQVLTFTNDLFVTASVTNTEQVFTFAVDGCLCRLHDSQPVIWAHDTIIIVVTNDPAEFADGDGLPNDWEIECGLDPLNTCIAGANSDGDDLTDDEEYLADTNPMDPASSRPKAQIHGNTVTVAPTSANRVYGLWWTDNLAGDPTTWHLALPEQAGNGAAVDFTPTGDLPMRVYRLSVRIP